MQGRTDSSAVKDGSCHEMSRRVEIFCASKPCTYRNISTVLMLNDFAGTHQRRLLLTLHSDTEIVTGGNNNDRGTRLYPVPMAFVYHTSHMDWPGIEPGSPRQQTGGQLPDPRHGRNYGRISLV